MKASTYLKKGYLRVIFRVFTGPAGGDVIALFPDLPECAPGHYTSYQHVGQHGAAELRGVLDRSRPATPAEAEPLYRELTGEPFNYKLVVRQRWVRLKD